MLKQLLLKVLLLTLTFVAFNQKDATAQGTFSAELISTIEFVDYPHNWIFVKYSVANPSANPYTISSYSFRNVINTDMMTNPMVFQAYAGGSHTVTISSGIFSYGNFTVAPTATLNPGDTVPLAIIRFDADLSNPSTGCTDMVWNTSSDFPNTTIQRFVDLMYQPNLDVSNYEIGNACYCSPPAGVSVTAVNPTSATVSWQSTLAAVQNRVSYKELGVSGITNKNATGDTKILNGLTPATNYACMVRSYCSDGSYSFRSNFSYFTTPSSSRLGQPVVENQVYPSPASETATVELKEGDLNVLLFDLTGKLIQEIQTQNQSSIQLEVSNLTEGIYLLQVSNLDGSIWSDRLVVQH